MGIESLGFLLFLIIGLLIYYQVKSECRWYILLIMSLLFYATYDVRSLAFILASAVSTYAVVMWMKRAEKKEKKIALMCGLLFNFGILGVVKYTNWLIDGVNTILQNFEAGSLSPLNIIVPLGISFYTFQITGYMLDVYWNKENPEPDFLKHLLFVTYFPQIIQGPISKHAALSKQLFEKKAIEYTTIKHGILLILWGYMKKMIVADTLAVAVSAVFDKGGYYGIDVVVGVLCYCAQLYCDFSGGIDVIRGVSYLFGVELMDNFRQPFFSKSIAEFWRRWHISLGIWMKDYVFYPLSLSPWMHKFGKLSKKTFGNKIGRKMPICLANIIVFFIVGVWHGAAWNYIVYGLYNGIIIAVSSLMEPLWDDMYSRLKWNKDACPLRLFRVVRTFVLVNIGWYFDRVTKLQNAFQLMADSLTKSTSVEMAGQYLGLYNYHYIYAICILVIVLVVSIAKERKIDIFAWINSRKAWIQFAIFLGMFMIIPIMGYFSLDSSATGGFIYANF